MEASITYQEIARKIDVIISEIDDLINEIERLGDYGQMTTSSKLQGKIFEKTLRLSDISSKAFNRIAVKRYFEEKKDERKTETANSTDK